VENSSVNIYLGATKSNMMRV